MNVIVCGPPASGKTTIATGLRERLDERGHEYQILHSDDYDRKKYDKMYERVQDGGDWILDGTFYDQEKRDRFRELGETLVAWAQADRDTCIERNENREDSIAKQGIYVMYSKFEEPDAEVELDTESLDVEASIDRLETAVLEATTEA